jgi:prepilin-type N-terminal cleavage/methylation domain-containing protein
MQQQGFTLMEVLIAMALIMVAALGGMQLVSMAIETMSQARRHSVATTLVSSRMEQLGALRFEFDPSGARITDTSADLTADPPALGGPGLALSGPLALDVNVPGYVDYLDARGVRVGAGASPPADAALVRRWAIEPADASGDLLVLQVLVRPLDGSIVPAGGRAAGEVRFATLRARVRR